MTVESVTFITDLDAVNPAGTDPKSEGDDHIRNIKTGLDGTFPNFAGIAMTATEAELNQSAGGGFTATAIIKEKKGADLASATALTLGTDGNYFDVTGTTAITSISSAGVGTTIKLHFDGILTLTHHATDLILPSGASIATAAGDEAEFIEYASGDWRCTNYSTASGSPVTPPTAEQGASLVRLFTNTHSGDATSEFLDAFTATYDEYWIRLLKVAPATDAVSLLLQLGTSGTYITGSSYRYAGHRVAQAASESAQGSTGSTSIKISLDTVGNAANEVIEGWVRIKHPFNTSFTLVSYDIVYFNQNTELVRGYGGGSCHTTASKTDVKLYFDSGTIASGEVIVYGVKS